ncbi:MAG TPA: hypothetical protein PLY31_09805, partial [Tenuifilaceae bacterium]|nr:hypothetical protein [Tenuifilaceae bacterium]
MYSQAAYQAKVGLKTTPIPTIAAQKSLQKTRSPFDELQKKYIKFIPNENFYTITLNYKRNIIASIHPNMEIRRHGVACINELAAMLKK